MEAHLLITLLYRVRLDELPEKGTGCCLQGLHGVSAKLLGGICIHNSSSYLQHIMLRMPSKFAFIFARHAASQHGLHILQGGD